MSQPPVTHKPIPRRVAAWRAELQGMRLFLRRLEANELRGSGKWKRGMLKHTRQRIDDLLDNAPVYCVNTGEGRQARRRA